MPSCTLPPTNSQRTQKQIGSRTSHSTEPTQPKLAKNAAIFKPRTLLHDASVNEFRPWQNRFQAYYDKSNVSDKGPALHPAFILTCIDDTLADIIDSKKYALASPERTSRAAGKEQARKELRSLL